MTGILAVTLPQRRFCHLRRVACQQGRLRKNEVGVEGATIRLLDLSGKRHCLHHHGLVQVVRD